MRRRPREGGWQGKTKGTKTMSKKIYTYKEASSEKVYSVSFTVDGVVHHLEAQCYTDDESIMDLPATWDVTDGARGATRTDDK